MLGQIALGAIIFLFIAGAGNIIASIVYYPDKDPREIIKPPLSAQPKPYEIEPIEYIIDESESEIQEPNDPMDDDVLILDDLLD